MQFRPKSDEEFKKLCVPAGDYQYKFISVTETQIKFGSKVADVFKCVVRIYDINDEKHVGDVEINLYPDSLNFKKFCCYNGLTENYDLGQVDSYMMLNRSGKFNLQIKEGNLKEDGTRYPDKNYIRNFIETNPDEYAIDSKFKDDEVDKDDDIPF